MTAERNIVVLTVLCACLSEAEAGVTSAAIKEAVEFVTRKFGKEAAEEGATTLAGKIEKLAVAHGEEALSAVKKVGPRTFRLAEEAGVGAPQAIKLMARSGDDAVWVVSNKSRMAIFLKYGDNAADAMMKHGELAEPLIQSAGSPAASALKSVSIQNGRRLAMMADDGSLTKIGRTEELLNTVGQYGDRAMDFVWANKASLTVAAGLSSFIAKPEPFIEGTVQLGDSLAENIGKPIASVPAQVAQQAAMQINWTLLLSLIAVIVGGIVSMKLWLRRRVATDASAFPTHGAAQVSEASRPGGQQP